MPFTSHEPMNVKEDFFPWYCSDSWRASVWFLTSGIWIIVDTLRRPSLTLREIAELMTGFSHKLFKIHNSFQREQKVADNDFNWWVQTETCVLMGLIFKFTWWESTKDTVCCVLVPVLICSSLRYRNYYHVFYPLTILTLPIWHYAVSVLPTSTFTFFLLLDKF